MPKIDQYDLKRSAQISLLGTEERTANLQLILSTASASGILTGTVTSGGQPSPGAGDYYVIATADDYKTSMEYRIPLKIGEDLSITIKLRPDCFLNLGTVYGTVRDDTGTKLSDAKVIIKRYNNSGKIAAITTSNTYGEYLTYELRPGKHWISAIKDGYSFYKKASFDIKSKDIIMMDLFLYEIIACRNGTISGQIFYKEQPVPHAIVALYRIVGDDHTLIQLKDSSGIYLFADITPGEYLIKSKHEGLEKLNSVNVNQSY